MELGKTLVQPGYDLRFFPIYIVQNVEIERESGLKC